MLPRVSSISKSFVKVLEGHKQPYELNVAYALYCSSWQDMSISVSIQME